MADPRQLERSAEQYIKKVASTNREIQSLIRTIQDIEKLAAAADSVDLRNSLSLKSDLTRLSSEVTRLQSNAQALLRELSDTNSKLRKALF